MPPRGAFYFLLPEPDAPEPHQGPEGHGDGDDVPGAN
jgi:hypothetical protein